MNTKIKTKMTLKRVTWEYRTFNVSLQHLIFGGAQNRTTKIYIGKHETRSVLPQIQEN